MYTSPFISHLVRASSLVLPGSLPAASSHLQHKGSSLHSQQFCKIDFVPSWNITFVVDLFIAGFSVSNSEENVVAYFNMEI